MIEIRNLQKSYGDIQVLNAINIDIQEGGIFGLVGRSGVGKSTLLRCINGLESYDSGTVMVNGQEVGKLKGLELRKFRRNVGMVFQHFSLTERDTVYQNVALPMKCWRYDKREIHEWVNELLRIVDLADKANEKPRNLSGGQKQRVAIARALALKPSILLCDEATSALDPKTTQSILSLLQEINKKLRVTIIIVTHEMSIVKMICDKVAVLTRDGVADVGDIETIFMNQSPALVELLGEDMEDNLPKNGKNLRIFYIRSEENQKLVSCMAKKTGVEFDLISAKTEKYRASIMNEIIIHISERDVGSIMNYLNQNHVKWEEVF